MAHSTQRPDPLSFLSTIRGHGCLCIFARGIEDRMLESLCRLVFEPDTK